MRGQNSPDTCGLYEAYVGAGEKVSALLRQIPWTHHLIILGQSKRPEEREFYLEIVAQQKWSSRQLERQFKLALFERAMARPDGASVLLGGTGRPNLHTAEQARATAAFS
ncbi:DUF1016 N-terminal domain-containing protein [Variovorax beijingensis]|uniref:DUF1016 N-terminal domain-containing protein n=1 Tax=Variovorax beijingensis TaxID=2496117 RepID=UPI00197F814B